MNDDAGFRMKTLHRYLTLQVVASLTLTVAVFTFVLLLGNILKEILQLLINGRVDLIIVAKAIGLLIPFVLVFALPIGFITATLLVFGRFSADQELTAARASGVSLLSLATPVLLLSVACCGLCAWINMDLGPRSRAAYTDLLFEARSELALSQLPERQMIYDFPGYTLYIDKNHNGNLQNVLIYSNTLTIMADTARIGPIVSNQFILDLTNATIVMSPPDGGLRSTFLPWQERTIGLNRGANKVFKPRISDMSFTQLQAELRDRERMLAALPGPTNMTASARGAWNMQVKTAEKLVQQARSQMHQELAFSFACFGFALVGIPLGIRVHRRETNIGVAMALILVLVYYSFVFLANSLSGRPELLPHLIFWIPNFIFQAVGAVLLWRANKGI